MYKLVFLILLPLCATAGEFPIGARSNALGDHSSTLIDPLAFSNNQAVLGRIHTVNISGYHQFKYLLAEASVQHLSFTLPTNTGTFGSSITSFGNRLYRETKLGIGFGKKIQEHFSIGVQVDVLSHFIKGYGSSFNLTFEGGFLAEINEQLSFGAHLFNPIRTGLGSYLEQQEKIPAIYAAGFNYHPDEKWMLLIEVVKESDHKPSFSGGMEFIVAPSLIARVGFNSNTPSVSCGAGFKKSNYQLDLAVTYDQYLGVTPGFNWIIHLKHEER